MSFWFHDALSEDASLPGAGGEASLPEIADAAIQSARYVDNTFAEQAALDEGIDRRNDAIFARTGVKLDNPFRQYARNARENVAPRIAKARAEYRAQLVSLEEQHPNARDAIRSHVSIEDDAAAIARAADERLGRLSASRDEIGKWGALFAGGFRGSLEDPLQVATLAIGGGTGAARTIFGRILSTAMREALVNGGVEAALQPQVQAWRKKAGLPNGFDEGLRNVGFATVLGGAFGAAGRSIAEGGQIALRGADLARATAELAPKLTESARAALGGDIATARAVLSEIKPALPPEARGALDALDADALVSARTPKGLDAGEHARAVEATARLADGEIDAIAPDAERLSRIAAELTMDDNAAVLSNLTEPPLRSGFTRVYHSGSIGDGKFGRWVSSNRTYAANYRQNSPLHFLDLPANDGRVINADYPDQQIKQGFTFNFELTPREAKRLKEIARQSEAPAPQTLAQFVAAKGGVKEFDGELKAIGADGYSKKFLSKLVKKNGRPLDDARLIAAEAGYFNRQYGGVDQAMERSTIQDLLDGLDGEMRGKPLYSEIDRAEGRLDGPDFDPARNLADVESRVADILRAGGPDLSDEIIAAAVGKRAGGMDPIAAIDAAALEIESRTIPRAAPAPDDDIPFFAPEADGLDDVPKLLKEEAEALTPDELDALADEDFPGGPDAWEAAGRESELANVLEFCKVS